MQRGGRYRDPARLLVTPAPDRLPTLLDPAWFQYWDHDHDGLLEKEDVRDAGRREARNTMALQEGYWGVRFVFLFDLVLTCWALRRDLAETRALKGSPRDARPLGQISWKLALPHASHWRWCARCTRR